MRERRGPSRDASVWRRFSPACAGETSTRELMRIETTVQPRVCGRDLTDQVVAAQNAGSAPRVRERQTSRPRPNTHMRFSPACAGETLMRCHSALTPPVQPRVCGRDLERIGSRVSPVGSAPRVRERRHARASQLRSGGSAPRVRERRWATSGGMSGRRFSPACAGETPSSCSAPSAYAVQPRVCGRDLIPAVSMPAKRGSAPRVRERLPTSPTISGLRRFSPACAGETDDSEHRRPRSAVQPRVCGRDEASMPKTLFGSGSAPRVRERRHDAPSQPPAWRFSPACAGETVQIATTRESPTVQPRVCGRDSFLGF
mgnify:CR=1 FL=1